MADKLDLLNKNVPLLDSYDKYLEWESQNSTISLQVVSQNLGIGIAYVEAFIDMGKLDTDEFKIIDDNKINIDSLVLILKEPVIVRRVIYENFANIVSNTYEPIKALRNFIDGDNEPLFRDKLESVSPDAYFQIAKYLKQTSTIDGTITKKFRKLIYDVGKYVSNGWEISDKQYDWVVRAITHSNAHSLSVFTNDIIKNDFPDDYLIFKEIISIIETQN